VPAAAAALKSVNRPIAPPLAVATSVNVSAVSGRWL
jgi:hypothetical protein